MKNVISLAVLVLVAFGCSVSKGGKENKETIKILTSAECGDCKDRIEGKLNYEKGIIFAELEMPSKILTVKYKKDIITAAQIRELVSKVGYDADDVKADGEALNKLPDCCKPGGME